MRADSKRAYRNVVFDLGRVLIEWEPERIAATISADPQVQGTLVRGVFEHEDWLELDRGTLTEQQALRRWGERTGLSRELLLTVMPQAVSSLSLIPHSYTLLLDLHAAGVKLYCLSNMSMRGYQHLKARYDFWDKFLGVVISSHIKLVKPEPAIYRYLLSEHNLGPNETIFIDDRRENIAAAEAFGITGIVFENAATCRERLSRLIRDL